MKKILFNILILALTSHAVLASSKIEASEISLCALEYMINRDSETDYKRYNYQFYALMDAELVNHFKGSKPKVVVFSKERFSTDSEKTIEVKSGKRVKVWEVAKIKIEGHYASVEVSWYSAFLAAGGHTISLEKVNGKWIVKSEKVAWIS